MVICVCVCVYMCPRTHDQLCPTLCYLMDSSPPVNFQQEYWSSLPFPSPGDIPDPGIEPGLLHWQVDSSPLHHLS